MFKHKGTLRKGNQLEVYKQIKAKNWKISSVIT